MEADVAMLQLNFGNRCIAVIRQRSLKYSNPGGTRIAPRGEVKLVCASATTVKDVIAGLVLQPSSRSSVR